jgi:hypothetical protein
MGIVEIDNVIRSRDGDGRARAAPLERSCGAMIG